MRKLISFVHLSLDGFVAGPNGEMNWITINEEIFSHVGKRIAKSDTALYGRHTYNMMENYWPTAADKPNATQHDIEHSAWYKRAHKIVLSNTMKDLQIPNTTIIGDHLSDQIRAIKEQDGEEILVFGSPGATHALMHHDLIDGYWLFVNPIVLGTGIPLFAGIRQKSNLKLESMHRFECGVVELCYANKD